jgi:hypothetical protein
MKESKNHNRRRTDRKTYRGRPGLAYIKQIMKDLGCITYVEMKKKG